MSRTHTLESCKASAAQFQTRSEWMRGDRKAYDAAQRNGWLDECCAHMVWQGGQTHTLESCMESAAQFQTRVDWDRGDSAAYQAARKNGWADECCAHMTPQLRIHTLESCMESAAQFQTRKDWDRGDNPAYDAARRNGWLETCCAHMTLQYRTHTLESCMESAAQFQTRADWVRGDYPAYGAAHRNGWLDECCAHMTLQHLPSDADTVYLWRAEGLTQDGKQVYKIGVTSWRLGEQRIKKVARSAGCAYTLLARVKCDDDAFTLEGLLLEIGEPLRYGEPFDGCTEFRALTDAELELALSNIEPLAMAA